jgi:hypothetical protein
MTTKKKKRLGMSAVAFLLMFVVGAAFAFTPGALDIQGTVSFEYDYVVWYAGSTAASELQVGATLGGIATVAETQVTVTHIGGDSAIADVTPPRYTRAEIVDGVVAAGIRTRDRDDQTLEWDVHFSAPGTVWVRVTPMNRSAIDAILQAPAVDMTLGTFGYTHTDFGLTYAIYSGALGVPFAPMTIPGSTGPVPTPHTSSVFVRLTWDGTIPIDPDFDQLTEIPAIAFSIVLEYIPA